MTNHNLFKVCKHALLASVVALPAFAFAASDGTVGPTSQGNVQVYINVGSQVKISGLTDYNHVWDGRPYQFTKEFCVYSNTPENKYSVTVNGTNNVGEFKLVNQQDPDHPLDYNVEYQDASAIANGYFHTVSAGQQIVNLTGSGAPDCSGANNAQLRFSVPQAHGTAGNYTGQVNVTVTPQ